MGAGILTGQETRRIKKIETSLDTKVSKDNLITGTAAEIQTMISKNQIPDGAYVFITDDANNTASLSNEELVSLVSTGTGYETNVSEDDYAHVEGWQTSASGKGSHAEGYITESTGEYGSHSEGWDTHATGSYSHAEGAHSKASADVSHAEGWHTEASGNNSHAEGQFTVASELDSHAQGYGTTASNYASMAMGRFNKEMVNGGQFGDNGTAMVIGNGTNDSTRRNALSVLFDGTVKAAGTITASVTADYAEFFEWLDGNESGEDRIGKFVTLDGDKIRIATSKDDYILGIISGNPFVLGNGDCDVWNGMILRDDYRRPLTDPIQKQELKKITKTKTRTYILSDGTKKVVETEEVVGEEYQPVCDEDGNPVYIGYSARINPEYDNTLPYKSRKERPEWDAVGMLGVLPVTQDGSLVVNGYATVNDQGIATTCEKNNDNAYRVIKIISNEVAEIIFK